MTIDRREFVRRGALAGALAINPMGHGLLREDAADQPTAGGDTLANAAAPFELEEATVAQLSEGLASGRYTARSLAEAYLARIDAMDRNGPKVNAVIETNPDALDIADAMDRERREKGARGPLHGIPVLIKDNIDTGDKMKTSAGSLALADTPAPRDSFVARRLREAGAVIIGKTNLSEWANFRSTRSVSGWSGRGRQTHNPYVLDRNPCGSSSGTGAAVSANFAAVGVGTETDGSVVCPSAANGLVGIKPTVGLVSRAGIVPISHTQDTAGAMCRSVADAATLLGALAGVDPDDAATAAARGHLRGDYRGFLTTDGLKGARIGVSRNYFGFSDRVDAIMNDAIAAMKDAGAVIVDPANFVTKGKFDDAEFDVLLYEFKADLNAYLAKSSSKYRTLADLIAFNNAHRDDEMPYFGQEIFEQAQKKGPLTDRAYRLALAKCRRMSRAEGIDALVAKYRLDAFVTPTGGPAWTTDLLNGDHFTGGSSTPAAVAGYPSITVPAGYIHGLPVGISFTGTAWSEPTLIRLAYAYEQATKVRRAPQFLPTADLS
ncbi:MAG TPA: amidase [Gemmatimonadaceae bacterium]|nr:amidase [Gemmatimonadaceae bacterium]